jgi:hemoglobin/transferrin/lactoferrin receptor protein
MHRFSRFAGFVWLLFAVSGAFAQVVSIRDMESYRPMELVTLASDEPRASAVTNTRGQADIRAFEGSRRIEIRRLGYATLHLSFGELKNSGFVVFLSPANISLDQVVVSATRWNQPRREVPARILSINPREIVLNNPQTTADMLALSGEVFIQKSQQGGGSPMIRGFATNRLLITVDGVRMNTAIFRSGNLQNVISLDALSIQNTEILFGPGSVMYGSDAIAGVMSFYTLRPEFSDTSTLQVNGSALTRYASANGEQTVHLDLKLGGKNWASVTSLSRNYFGNLKMGSFGPRDYLRPEFVIPTDTADVVLNNDDPRIQRPTGYSQINLMQKIRFRPSEAWDLNYGWHYSTTSDYSRYDRLIRYRGSLPRSAEWYYGPQVWLMNNLSVSHKRSTPFRDRAELRLAYQYFKESRIDRDFNDTELRTRTEKVNAFSANLDYIKDTWGPVKMLYGFELVANDVLSEGADKDVGTGITFTGPSRYPQSEWYSLAAYLTGQAALSDKTNLQAGVRYNQYILNALFDTSFYPFPFTSAKINDGALSGSLGFIYSPSPNWALNVNLSSGFRSPNVDDLGKVFDSEPGAVVVPNPDLKAEYAWNFEAGLARVFAEKIKLDFSYYYTLLENAMVRRDFLLNGLDSIFYNGELSRVQAVQNAAHATIYGIQAGLEVKLPSGFGLSSHINVQHGEEELDNGSYSPLRHAAPWYGTTRLSYSAKKLKTDVYAVYNGAVTYLDMPEEEKGKAYLYAADRNGNPWSPGWFTLNLKVKYRFNPHFAITGGIENITDRRYKPYSSGIAAAGRSFQAGMRADF